jgi:hypothetical protein
MLPGTFVEKVFYFDEKENFVVGAFFLVNIFNFGITTDSLKVKASQTGENIPFWYCIITVKQLFLKIYIL